MNPMDCVMFFSTCFGGVKTRIPPKIGFFTYVFWARISGPWMSHEGSAGINGDRINGLFNLLINGVCWGYTH